MAFGFFELFLWFVAFEALGRVRVRVTLAEERKEERKLLSDDENGARKSSLIWTQNCQIPTKEFLVLSVS